MFDFLKFWILNIFIKNKYYCYQNMFNDDSSENVKSISPVNYYTYNNTNEPNIL